MGSNTVVETVYGKHCKYEIVKVDGGVFGSSKYVVYKNGKPGRSFSSLSDAVEAAKREG